MSLAELMQLLVAALAGHEDTDLVDQGEDDELVVEFEDGSKFIVMVEESD